RVQAPASLAQALAESFGAEAERLRTEPRELPLEGLRSQQPDAGALASTSLGQHQLAAALEQHLKGGRLRAAVPGTQVPEPPRRHQMHHQRQPPALGLEEQSLATPLCAGQALAVQL